MAGKDAKVSKEAKGPKEAKGSKDANSSGASECFEMLFRMIVSSNALFCFS